MSFRVIKAAPLVFLAFLLAGCLATNSSSTGFNIVPVSQETEIGRQISQRVERKFPAYPDRGVQLYVTYLGDRLVKAYGGPLLFDFHFKVLDGKEVNAFNIPGGYIYVYRGLIAKTENEAELASVLAHEIGHAVARHSTKLMSAQLGVSFILSMLLGPETSQWERIVSDLFTGAGILAYTRSMEREADRLGIYIMYQAGYDPAASVAFMQKMLALKKREPQELEKLFSSHPTTVERMQNARNQISKLNFRKGLFLNTTRFNQVKKTVMEDPYPSKERPYRR